MVEGIIGRKISMTQVFGQDGRVDSVTAIEAGPCFVIQIKRVQKEGYDAVQLGFGEAKRLNQPLKGHLKKLGMLKHLREFKTSDIESIEIGHKVDVSIFKAGDVVDVSGISKGKGFAGVVKRYHFGGGPKTHGQSDRHRAPGSIGAGTTPGRVLKGQRMAGHMGNERVTVRKLKVIEADPERNLLLVRGAVPGARNGLVTIRKSSG
ncbi:MAG: 50S ribosomal protein L3 [Dehalococcoidia bacterium]|jgi:large subunit ribosomal protein L3|nr:50S ribosomal protein L3 [Chloroflexota bacterium]MCK4242219.1 50S ribosomal protein L3 [Dehalococcoidia bacterium]